jgi:hypothetical protein
LGQIVRSEIGTADILCDSPDFYCRYYRVTVPQDGTLDVGMTHTPGRIYSLPQAPIDMWITLPYGRRLWMEGYRGPNVVAYAHAPVAAGETLEIGVVSYEVPGVTFELTFSLAR